jgi:hypothetical protein
VLFSWLAWSCGVLFCAQIRSGVKGWRKVFKKYLDHRLMMCVPSLVNLDNRQQAKFVFLCYTIAFHWQYLCMYDPMCIMHVCMYSLMSVNSCFQANNIYAFIRSNLGLDRIQWIYWRLLSKFVNVSSSERCVTAVYEFNMVFVLAVVYCHIRSELWNVDQMLKKTSWNADQYT